MKKNRFILIITLLLLVIAVFFIYNSGKGTLSKSLSDFAVNDTSLITKIFLTDKANNKVELEKKAQGDWSVNNKFKGSNEYINIFLKTLMRLEVKAPVARAARNTIIRRLAAIGVKTEIYQIAYRIDLWGVKLFPHEKLVKTYYVGDATMDNMGTYMLIENSDNPFIMHIPGFRGFLNSRYSTLENDWRDHTLFNIEIPQIQSVKLKFPSSPDSSYVIQNTGKAKFSLTALSSGVNIRDYDTLKLLDCLSSFNNIKFEFILSDSSKHVKDSIIKTPPFHILTVKDISGNTTVIKTFHKKAPYDQAEFNEVESPYDMDRLYALINDGKDFALIQFYVFDNILRPLAYFQKRPGANSAKSK